MSTITAPITGPVALPGVTVGDANWRSLLTASRMPAVLGVSDYTTAFEVAAEMLGLKEPFEGNEATRRGNRYEPAIVADYAERAGVEVIYPCPTYAHRDLAWLAATPDAMVVNPADRLVQAKLTMSPKRAAELGDEETDQLPDDWLVQGQTELLVTERERVDFAVLLYGRLKVYEVHRNEKLCRHIRERGEQFMAMISKGELPPPDFTHKSTSATVKALYRAIEEGEFVDLDDEAATAWDQYKTLGKEITEREATRKSAQARVLAAMKTAAVGWLPDGRQLTRSLVQRNGYEVKACEYIQLREKKPSRR